MSETDVNRLFLAIDAIRKEVTEQGETLAGIIAVAKVAAWAIGVIGLGGIAVLLQMAGGR